MLVFAHALAMRHSAVGEAPTLEVSTTIVLVGF